MALENKLAAADTANRRGLLLGFTLSEIMMIILFSLLLLFAVVAEEQDETKAKAAELESQAQDAVLVRRMLDSVSDMATSLGVAPNLIEDLFKTSELVSGLRREIGQLQDRETTLTPAEREELQDKQKEVSEAEDRLNELRAQISEAVEANRAAAKLAQDLLASGISTDEIEQVAERLSAQQEVQQDLSNRLEKAGLGSEQVKEIIQAAADKWSDTAMDNRNLSEQRDYWRSRWENDANSGKRGVTPCWVTDGVIDFIYDVALTDDGMIVRKNMVPQWSEDYGRLPVTDLKLDVDITQSQFVQWTRPLFLYSDRKDCRFFVRIFDETSENAKLTYQKRRRAVEGHFFIKDMKSARFYADD